MTAQPSRTIDVELLYLDLSQCQRCTGAQAALTAALDALKPAFAAIGAAPRVTETHVASLEQARALDFIASPTIRIDGRDIQPEAHLNRCEDCGTLCNCLTGVDCRLWEWRGQRQETPPVGLIMEQLMASLINQDQTAPNAPSPAHRQEGEANIEKFFASAAQVEGRPSQSCCASDCCQ